MCGIIAGIAETNITPILMKGLSALEYRGYDSAGIGVLDGQKPLQLARNLSGVSSLKQQVEQQHIQGHIGIAHTRWATHGQPSVENAHPHLSSNRVAVVHNGIIENHQALHENLQENGYIFNSQTDSEVIAHLIHFNLGSTKDFLSALLKALKQLKGNFALAILDLQDPSHLYLTANQSPLIIGMADNYCIAASDMLAFNQDVTQQVFPQDQQLAIIHNNHVDIKDFAGQSTQYQIQPISTQQPVIDQDLMEGTYMLKEIHEQPKVLTNLCQYYHHASPDPLRCLHHREIQQIHLIGCGSSYHAACIASNWFESALKIPTQAYIASEYRYGPGLVPPNTIAVFLSQSGETADTLGALSVAKGLDYLNCYSICNQPHSSLVRHCDATFPLLAGPEIGVASTKAFLAQLFVLYAIVGAINPTSNPWMEHTHPMPQLVESVIKLDAEIQQLADQLLAYQQIILIGRGILYPVALEGALKLKELTYLHCHAYPAGELKHGPLALIDEKTPVIALMSDDEASQKIQGNIEEIRSRKGQVFTLHHGQSEGIQLPSSPTHLTPFTFSVALQMLAYHLAKRKDLNVDRPRNLAKSVTVE
ncbi:glutamine--fructose-6-phosphate transaminase (isomerizing) [Gammaproteobacteria bacterium]|nr:glutamine--fructose-6-phosphate transaminase (isomerizing) [Gammaproteobacteria bacterium]